MAPTLGELARECLRGQGDLTTRNKVMKQMYNRAQQMILTDKFKHNKQEFFKELTNLLNAYVDYDCVTVETMQGKQLNMVITVTLKDNSQG